MRRAGLAGLLAVAMALPLAAQSPRSRSADVAKLQQLLADGAETASAERAASLFARAAAAKDAWLLNELAWAIVDPDAKVAPRRDLELAMRAATLAVESGDWQTPNAIDTLARVHAWHGDFAKAAEVQRRAMALLPGAPVELARGVIAESMIEYEGRLRAAAPPPAPRGGLRVPTGCAAASASGVDGWCKVVVHKATGMRLRLVAGGEFTMGASTGEADELAMLDPVADRAEMIEREQPQRRVRVSSFYLAEQEASVAQWRRFVGASGYVTDAQLDGESPGGVSMVLETDQSIRANTLKDATWENPLPVFAGRGMYRLDERHPVAMVSWNDAMVFCAHFGMRLPTEAEWEYACRGGATTRFAWGDDPAGGKDKENVLDQPGASYPLAGRAAHRFPFHDGHCFYAPVDALPAGPWGLRSLHGNVSEWCADRANKCLLASFPADAVAVDPVGRRDPTLDHACVSRGGNWGSSPMHSRIAARRLHRIGARYAVVGFRPALSRN